jgi:hypothetical protein
MFYLEHEFLVFSRWQYKEERYFCMKDKSEILNNNSDGASHTTSDDQNVKLRYIYLPVLVS